MADYRFKTPLSEADVRQLRVGDSVQLDGVVFGIRDANMIRVFDQHVPPPVNWNGAALLHTAPNVRKRCLRPSKICSFLPFRVVQAPGAGLQPRMRL